MDTPTVGQLITTPQTRDAIHVAIAPVRAAEYLKPGQRVNLNTNGEAYSSPAAIGIVDPFLMDGPLQGEQFWLFLYPNTVTSLRHYWTHPAFLREVTTSIKTGSKPV